MRARHLLEVVLFSPVETVMEPWFKRAPNDNIKQWLNTVFKNWLMKTPQNLHKFTYLPLNATDKQKAAYKFDNFYDVRLSPSTENELEHMMDFFENNPDLPRLNRMSVEAVYNAADNWVKEMNAKAKKQPDNPKLVKTLMEFPGGYRVVDLIGQAALEKEGAKMGHCVGGQSYCDLIKSGRGKIYSLRDGNNNSLVTIAVDSRDNSTDQIQGAGNQPPVCRYWPMLRAFFEKAGIKVEGDYQNVGLLRMWDGEKYVNSTQDAFKDMILDPANQEGQKLLKYYEAGGGARGSGFDLVLGVFSALYGSDRLSDTTVRVVFTNLPIPGGTNC